MKVFVIHDLRRPDTELVICERELQRQGITEYGVWPAITSGCETVPDCIAMSHKNVIRQAQEMDLEEVCVMESDVWFPVKGSWDYFLRNKPSVYDMWLASTYSISMDDMRNYASFRKSKRGPVTPYSVSSVNGMHCYIMHSRYFDTFLLSPPGHIDVAQDGRGDFRVCYPFAALQRESWSENNKKIVNYNTELRKADVYRGEPDDDYSGGDIIV